MAGTLWETRGHVGRFVENKTADGIVADWTGGIIIPRGQEGLFYFLSSRAITGLNNNKRKGLIQQNIRHQIKYLNKNMKKPQAIVLYSQGCIHRFPAPEANSCQ